MRWDNLFDDLESQLEQELSAEEVDLHAEEERLRLARLGIRDRLFAVHARGSGETERALRLRLRDGTRVSVVAETFGRDWFAGEILDDSERRPACVVPLDAVAAVTLTPQQVRSSLDGSGAADEHVGALSARLGLPFVLRDLCRRRRPVELLFSSGALHGTVDRVGRDHLDIAVHEPGMPRRESAVTEYRMVRLDEILLVRL
jgi:hypothetical protein